MKKFIVILAIFLADFAFAQTMYINNIKADLMDPQTKKVVGEIYEGTSVEVLKKDGDMSLVQISGAVSDTNKKVVALKKDPFFVFYKLNDKDAQSKDTFLVKTKELTDDELTSWEEIDLTYYDTCSSCHAAHKPKEHLMSEWEAYLLAMQTFAKINDKEKDRILRYLQAFAKDGVVKE
ncbi:molybdopterin-containing oxidoreductase I, DMSO/TMAO/BSO reductase family, monoheme c-type cytochrome [Campylobacter pinnipediorum subsp. caledonicus]|uniref:Molybdopterin-containing oxidoreductase I, DMSO/TMAO/BSO reductase family, monoheme c-type cytochrome n=1 Tax=Campylobacter pinnipediorum subsp. caledonicus TaxID=1874362 RepID=A0A1S6U9I0_9BACT|nr:hypothetical protein [Campylobacter pinnipediorum]AQW86741.1 molybdopterin-containing oxidoreductase I, DMSO/TMAO/BSO reductase family, monoheme c-type cytochrome [Campylobacter pinnipediorum subsp. caledonicus]AQW88396.1 molybdopterin-containing oxidoreductase I, DMSO/TMAO/BSO reductase family, monoheme c-type cytochrome [Campylobacter pinnipediorum subsp. caledonicus]OPA72635.1 hypothetical protein BB381_05430 [Campylobacter pinnipediorum subsp. caledonicus]